jgi:hypothetical protein
MKEILIHIGMHKTGTTSIQESLHKVNREGFRTLRFHEKNHSIPMYTIFSEDRYNFPIWKKKGLTVKEIDQKAFEFKKKLEEELADQTVSVFLVSGEAISLLNEDDQQRLCQFFKEKNLKVKIIYVVRDPRDFARSSIQQKAKGFSTHLPKINPNYRSRISGFLKNLGKENIFIYKYEELVQNGLIKSFSKVIGLNLKEYNQLNESLTSDALALIIALNKIEISTHGSELKFRAKTNLINLIRDFFSQSNGFNKINLDKYDLLEDIEDDLVWLKKNFGIEYPIYDQKYINLNTYEYTPSSKVLSKFFHIFGLNYKSSLTLVTNMQNLYKWFLKTTKNDELIKSFIKEKKFFEALELRTRAIALGDNRKSSFAQASYLSTRCKNFEDAEI